MTTTQELMKLADAYAEYRDHSEYVHARAALETAIQALQADSERLQSGYLKIRVALGLNLHSTDNLLDVIGALKADAELYKELLFCVAKKYPGESRHQTAKRYLLDREKFGIGESDAAKGNV